MAEVFCGACTGALRPKVVLKSKRPRPDGCAEGLACRDCGELYPCHHPQGHLGPHLHQGIERLAEIDAQAPPGDVPSSSSSSSSSSSRVAAIRVEDLQAHAAAIEDGPLRHALRALLASARHGEVAEVWWQPPREARHATLPPGLAPALTSALARDGAPFRPYAHQAEAIRLALDRQNVVVATGTGSGKSQCYNVPVLETLLRDPQARALYVFPTRALAADQLRALRETLASPGLSHLTVESYDGDTPKETREFVRHVLRPRIVVTTPDMLHFVLCHHRQWSWLLGHLRHVVIDEVHVYKGVFGSHVANILRRLRRVAAHYRADPRFVCCSATISDADRLAERLCGVPFRLVSDDASPRGARTYVFWNPPQEQAPGEAAPRRIPPHAEATRRLIEHVRARVRTIAFARSRRQAELILRNVQRHFQQEAPHLERRVESYRSGYTAQERREIERRLAEGELLGVASTNALELGVDVGGLDGCIVTTFPGSIASFRQQAGRAGRAGREALVTFIADDDPVNQHWLREARRLIEGASEAVALRHDSEAILDLHVRCALAELPSGARDDPFFGAAYRNSLDRLERAGLIERGGAAWVVRDEPHGTVTIRNATADRVAIYDRLRRRTVGETDTGRVFQELHEDAVYMHRGETYVVEDLDLAERRAVVRPEKVSYHTEPRVRATLEIRSQEERRTAKGFTLTLGAIEAREQVTGFVRIGESGRPLEGEHPLDLPAASFRTRGVSCRFSPPWGGAWSSDAVHAVQHLLAGLVPVVVACDRTDVRFPCPDEEDETHATAHLYDAYEGGVGIAEAVYERFEDLLGMAAQAVESCRCATGCPGCIQHVGCARRNRRLSKAGAIDLLRHARGRPKPS